MSETNHIRQRVQELGRKLHEAAVRSASRRFHALYDKLTLDYILEAAWRMVAENGGAPGVDGETIDEIQERGVAEFLEEIATELKEGTYRPQPVLRVYIPKPDGSERPLGIPTVKDRVVQAAAKLVLEPIFEADFTADSYGFRPGRGAVDALKEVGRQMWGSDYVVDADIEAYFDNVDHRRLKRLLRLRISDRRMLALIEGWLRCGVEDEEGRHCTPKGVPQGGVLSPLLANIYLNYLDRQWQKHYQKYGKLVRYADDFIILCRTREDAEGALAAVQEIVRKLGLRLHPQKTRVVETREGKEGFDFLGIHFRKVRQCKNPRAFRPTSWPSAKSLKAVREKVRQWVRATPFTKEGYAALKERLRKYLGGWANYFKHSWEAERKFVSLDYWVKGQLLAWELRRTGSKREVSVVRKVIDQIRGLPRLVRPNNWGRSAKMAYAC